MGGLKKGTGSLNFEDEESTEEKARDDHEQGQESEAQGATESNADAAEASATEQQKDHVPTSTQDQDAGSTLKTEPETDTNSTTTDDHATQSPDIDVDNLPYLVQRQMRGASVNADRTNQLLLEVRQFVKENEDTFLHDLQDLVDGPVYKGDAREAAMIVAHENPELVAEKLREWGIQYLDK
jgi:hypothetical protein